MKKNKFVLLLLLSFTILVAQNKKVELNTEVVDVIRSYTPVKIDFKKVVSPLLKNYNSMDKLEVNYDFLKLKVIPKFNVSSMKMKKIVNPPPKKIKNNFFKVGFANYKTVNVNFYFTKEYKSHTFVGYINHLSSQGGIDEYELDNSFANTSTGIFHQKLFFKYLMTHNLEYSRRMSNYYGEFSKTTYPKEIDVGQLYNIFSLLGKISSTSVSNPLFEKLNYKFNMLNSKNSNIKEYNLEIKSLFNLKLGSEILVTNMGLNYNKNTKKKSLNFVKSNAQENHVVFNISSKYKFIYDRFSLYLGAGYSTFLSEVKGNKQNDWLVYPVIEGNYSIVKDLALLYVNLRGGITQNFIQQLIQNNPFIKDDFITLKPTTDVFNLSLGMKGILIPKVNYNVSLVLKKQRDFVNFISYIYPIKYVDDLSKDIQIYKVEYKDVFFSILKANISYINDRFTTGLFTKFNYHRADVDSDNKELNYIPTFETKWSTKYKIINSLNIGADMFFVTGRTGDAKDKQFLDLNFNSSYIINNKLSIFINFNNILNKSYQLWNYYKVQGFQVMGGLTYKF